MKPIQCLLLLFFILTIPFSYAQDKPSVEKRSYQTKALGTIDSPVIDGLINEEAWNTVDWTGDYIENQPDENTPPSEQTKFKIVYDKKYLYFAFKCYDKDPKGIVKRLSRRDGFEGDWVEINIDSYHDQRTGFSFTVSVSGVKGDEFISENGNNWDGSWNPIWYMKTNIDDEGWTAEVKIPFSQLKFGDAKEQVWGLQSTRRYFRAEERSVWQRVPPDAPGWVSEFGELRGITDIEPQKQVEIQPFVVAQQESYPQEAGNPFRDGNDKKLNGGLDAKIGLTNDLTLDLTINPDFGQVEADPAAISLDGFQIFFEEKRPFFVENKNIFNFRFADGSDNLFYSRRIGRSPQGYPSKSGYTDIPDNTTILGAAKFSGKTQSGWSIGILESVTDKEFARIDDGLTRTKELVEPMTNYFVGRLQKDFNNRNSYIGGMFTAVNRKLEGTSLDFLHSAAYAGGIDFKHNWNNRKYYVTGNFALSNIHGSETAITNTQQSLAHLFQRSDAEHISVDPTRKSLTGTGGRLEAGRASDGNWRYYGVLVWRSPELELNDVGFMHHANEIREYAGVTYQTLKPFGAFRKLFSRFEQFTSFDFDGNYNRIQYSMYPSVTFKNNWNMNAQLQYKPRIYTNTILQGGPRFRYSTEVFESINFNSDSRKKFRYYGGIYASQGKDKSFSYTEYDAGFTYQPINALTFSLSPNYNKNTSKTQYITGTYFGNDPRYIMGELDQRTLSASVRLDFNINPNLTVQYYGQPFISRGRYKNLKRVTSPTADDFRDRTSIFTPTQINFNSITDTYFVDENTDGTPDYTVSNPDFSFVQFRSNLVVRWEYIPGSEIFLVWSQGMTGNALASEDLFSGLDNQILSRRPENIFLLKATYRFIL
jgi:hypothetical protein